jgi:hypothetical protein
MTTDEAAEKALKVLTDIAEDDGVHALPRILAATVVLAVAQL